MVQSCLDVSLGLKGGKVRVINNETGEVREFQSLNEAIAYQEYLVFICGIDAEVL